MLLRSARRQNVALAPDSGSSESRSRLLVITIATHREEPKKACRKRAGKYGVPKKLKFYSDRQPPTQSQWDSLRHVFSLLKVEPAPDMIAV